MGLCTELSGEHSVDLLDSIGFDRDRVGDETMEVVEVDFLGNSLSEGFDEDGHVGVGELLSKFRETLQSLSVLLKGVLILVELEDAHHVRLDLCEAVGVVFLEFLGVLDNSLEDDISFLLEMSNLSILSSNSAGETFDPDLPLFLSFRNS